MRIDMKFENEQPLYTTVLCGEPHPEHIPFHELDLDSFPLIADFRVLVGGRSVDFAYVEYSSYILGLLTTFVNWNDADERLQVMKIEDIPLGTMEKPWNDIEQGFELDIWEKDGFVYVILGDEPCTNKFEVWYRVRKGDYVQAWKDILARYQ
ncbi:hypothetical protein EU528_04375 [Candidatus Thorarchaeota archaeon]|nr:MAG: hypothetical protein EU528_04375 [Candidatus Thorarchaeota archaeon]